MTAIRQKDGPRMALPTAAITGLTALLGDRFTMAPSIIAQHAQGEAHHKPYPPDAVAFALSLDDVVQTVRMCAHYDIPVIAFGIGTSLEGHVAAVRGGITLNLSRMNAILAVNGEDLDCVVQPGVTREQLNAHLRDSGLFFPIDPGANATIGGMASTRASGTNAVRYGTMRENILSLQVVLPDGQVIETGTHARKSAAGYDLTHLFVGAEGTLGIITRVTLRLHGIPEVVSAAICPFDTLSDAVRSVIDIIQTGIPVARVELLDDVQIDAVNRWSKTDYPVANTLFFEFHGASAAVAEQVATVNTITAANSGGAFRWATLPEDRNRLWKARHDAYYAAVALQPGARGWSTDVCVPISMLADCILATKQDLLQCPVPATIVGHVGDGNFHVIFAVDPSSTDQLNSVARVNDALVARALAMGGTCTGEHGIGIGKIESLRAQSGAAVDVMRLLKQAIDPQGIMNPGKIFV